METVPLRTFYIVGDIVVDDTETPKHFDYRVQASTIHGAQEFLRMVQNERRRNPDFKF